MTVLFWVLYLASFGTIAFHTTASSVTTIVGG